MRVCVCPQLAMQVGGSTVASATAPSSQSSPALSTIDHLVESYGDRAQNILQLAKQKGLGAQLVPGHPYIDAEVVYCVQVRERFVTHTCTRTHALSHARTVRLLCHWLLVTVCLCLPIRCTH